MNWSALFDRLLPIITLILGAALARGGGRREQRLAAARELSEVNTIAWEKFGEDGWPKVKAFLGKLEVSLRAAGVPQRLVTALVDAVEAHWVDVYESGDEEIGLMVGIEQSRALEQRQRLVMDYLDRSWRLVRRYKAWRAAGRPVPPASV